MSENGFCPIINNQDGRQNRYPLFTTGHYAGPFCQSLTVLCRIFAELFAEFLKNYLSNLKYVKIS